MHLGARMKSLLVAAAAAAMALLACAPPPPPQVAQTTTTASEEVAQDPKPLYDLVLEPPQIEHPDYHAKAVENAESVLGAMHGDLLACYAKRLAVNPQAHGFITADVIVGPDGRVRNVETTGGAILGEATMRCIVGRIERATFEPPHGGGTLRVQVPFAFRRVAPGETP